MIVSWLISILVLVDGYIHLQRSGVFGRPGGPPPISFPPGASGPAGAPPGPPPGPSGPPPSPPNQLPLPLDQLFLLNAIGYALLLGAFWLGPGLLGSRRWLIDVALIIYALAAIPPWIYIGMPNPLNQGYVSKAIEVVMIFALLVHMRMVTGRGRRWTVQVR